MTSRLGASTPEPSALPPGASVSWLPPNAASAGPLAAVEAGEYWDAVRAPEEIVCLVVAALDRLDELGALLLDPLSGAYYWFVPPGYAQGVTAGLPGVRALGRGAHLVVAAATVEDGIRPHWRQPPLPGRWITSPGALRTALASAVGVELPPLRGLPSLARVLPAQVQGLACIWCERALEPDAVPYPSQPLRTSGGPDRWYPRACPECAR